jgi:hypothetical protein
MIFRIFALALTLCSCSSFTASSKYPVQGKDYIIETGVNDNSKVFDIELKSTSPRKICISPGDWPLENGLWRGESGLFQIKSEGLTIDTPDENAGHCIGKKCIIEVKPGRSIHATLRYEVFRDANSVVQLPRKTLVVNLAASTCPR